MRTTEPIGRVLLFITLGPRDENGNALIYLPVLGLPVGWVMVCVVGLGWILAVVYVYACAEEGNCLKFVNH